MRGVWPSRATERPWPNDAVIPPGLSLNETGLVVGQTFVLAPLSKRQTLVTDPNRVLALLSIGYRRSIAGSVLKHIEAAYNYWRQGDKTLANIRLLSARLPRLDQPGDIERLLLAEWLLDAGLSPHDLMRRLDLDTGALEVRKYDPNQPRVPPGHGKESGRWGSIWHGIEEWLEEPVPEYDLDTGDQVGTRTRARAIATNPLTIISAAGVALAATEAILAGGAVAAAEAAAPVVIEEAGLAANAARGLASQARVLKDLGLVKNTVAVVASEGSAIPDALTAELSIEIKDSIYVSATKQLRVQTEAASLSGRISILITGERTKISKKALKIFDEVLRRTDLGPR